MQQSAEKVRKAADSRDRLFELPGAWLVVGRIDPGVDVNETEARAADGPALALRIYRPKGNRAVLPVVVNFHGGGWVSGNLRHSDWWCSSMAAQAGVVVV